MTDVQEPGTGANTMDINNVYNLQVDDRFFSAKSDRQWGEGCFWNRLPK